MSHISGNNLKNSKVIFRCPKKIVTIVRFNFSNYSNVGSSEFLKFPHYKQLPVHAINNITYIINSSQSQCRTNGLVQVPEDIPIARIFLGMILWPTDTNKCAHDFRSPIGIVILHFTNFERKQANKIKKFTCHQNAAQQIL